MAHSEAALLAISLVALAQPASTSLSALAVCFLASTIARSRRDFALALTAASSTSLKFDSKDGPVRSAEKTVTSLEDTGRAKGG